MSVAANRRFLHCFLGAFLLVAAWYLYAADYSYRAVAGTYVLTQDSNRWTLRLHENKSFEEAVEIDGMHQDAKGTWRRLGEGGVAFGGGFIPPAGVSKLHDTVYAEANKSYTIRPSLDFSDGRVRFYKRPFR